MANTRAQKTAQNLSTLTTAGDIAYASAAGTPARLGIGSSAQVLTVASGVPSWATAASGLTLLRRTSFSAVTTTTTSFDSIATTSYKAYLMVIETIKSSGTANIYLQFRKTAVTQATGYYGASYGVDSAGSSYTFLSSNASQYTVFSAGGTGNEGAASIYFYQMGSGTNQISMGAGTFFEINNSRGGTATLMANASNQSDGWIFSASTGTITGTVAIYGLASA